MAQATLASVGDEAEPLRYVARAGLLPELSRQTYDSLYKALREAILNGFDAGADLVEIDCRSLHDGEIEIRDNGSGMTMDDLRDSFMSLGGSSKFGEASKFGRIGIGSLALLHYADSALITTKTRGTTTVTSAVIQHPWSLMRDQREIGLGDFVAGHAETVKYKGSRNDHFTSIRLRGVSDQVHSDMGNVSSFYALVERLRRILPLAYPKSEVMDALRKISPELADVLANHTATHSGGVIIRSMWADLELDRRHYGDGSSTMEQWNGQPLPILKDVVISDESGERTVLVAGYLLSQTRANAAWSGVTARVQNVSVEERTFFDVETDPGFRKYITGEIHVLGDVDRSRLINIDRSSFNRECVDYQAVQRYMASAITAFKSASVQRPQRQKTQIKRILDKRLRLIDTAQRLGTAADRWCEENDIFRLPSSETNVPRSSLLEIDLADQLGDFDCQIDVSADQSAPFKMTVNHDGNILVTTSESFAHPTVDICGKEYEIVLAEAGDRDRAVSIRNRPPEIVFNASHHLLKGESTSYEIGMALELASVLRDADSVDALYDRVVDLVAVH